MTDKTEHRRSMGVQHTKYQRWTLKYIYKCCFNEAAHKVVPKTFHSKLRSKSGG